MVQRASVRRLLLGLVMSFALAGVGMTLPVIPGAVQLARAQISAEFREALAPYGHWERHPRWGAIWLPDDVPPDWRPYEYGHWVYTDEWGWYWISDPEEEDWGWVTFHYGRWAFERRLGWFWIPEDEWAPAWVDWRYGDGYVGWAPMPPQEIIYQYDDNPIYWVFVAPRYLTAPRLHTYIVPARRRAFVLRRTRIVNRTLRFERSRAAVNAGLSPAFVARATRTALPTYRVSPRVLSGTQGVAGAVRVTPEQLRAGRSGGAQRGRRPSANRVNAVAVQPTTTTIKPAASAAAPTPLGKGERGKLGTHPPRAAQGAPSAPAATAPARPSSAPPARVQQQKPPSAAAPAQPHAPAPRSAQPASQPPQAARPQRPAAKPAPRSQPPQAARPQRPAAKPAPHSQPPQAARPQRPAAKPVPRSQPPRAAKPQRKPSGKQTKKKNPVEAPK
jgi:hypothetical protein